MKAAIIQSNYLPWREYFDFIDSVDLFIVYDDVQFTRRDWRTRNLLKTPHGPRWLSVPVRYRERSQLICETEIDYSRDWRAEHLNLIRLNLAKAPHLRDALALIEPVFDARHRTISDLNVALLRSIGAYLGIATPLRMSSELSASGTKTERLIQLLAAAGATEYLSGPGARGYLEESRFEALGIGLEYKTYDYAPYPQQWGPFDGAVSIVDTIANCGPAARATMKERRVIAA